MYAFVLSFIEAGRKILLAQYAFGLGGFAIHHIWVCLLNKFARLNIIDFITIIFRFEIAPKLHYNIYYSTELNMGSHII